ncbi:MAG: O-antigen ligase family protein [Anaerolineae bacterium]|jgi:tetratricopeptide (TPR) repeat protein/O-antigen ligase|nr:hypothetical protein [Chloroflexota bacterium]
MSERLRISIAQVLEQLWLLAMVVLPLFFNVHSFRVFEPDKIAIFRSLATLMALLAALSMLTDASAGRLHTLAQRLRRSLRNPVLVSALAVALASVLASFWSIHPHSSWWGSYQRLQGTFSTLSYLVLFLCVWRWLRNRAQAERLVTIVLLTSLPIVLYGIAQHHGLDPLPWEGDVTQRVVSTLGNAIFLGAWLVMVIPLTLARCISECRAIASQVHSRVLWSAIGVLGLLQLAAWLWLPFGWAAALMVTLLLFAAGGARLSGLPVKRAAWAAFSAVLTASQMAALLYSGSRGPQVGLLAGLASMALLGVGLVHSVKLARASVILVLALVALLIIVNLPASPLAGVRELPYVGRLARLLETDRGTGRVRTLIWEGALDLLASDPLRAAIGNGPETMALAYSPWYPAALSQVESRSAIPDRAHNETLDLLITTGLPGLLAWYGLFLSLLTLGLRRLGLLEGRRATTGFFALSLGGGLLAVGLVTWLDGSLRLAGVALPLGVLMAAAARVATVALRGGAAPTAASPWQRLLLVAVLGALAAHWIEISVGIAIGATRALFWALAGLLAGVLTAPSAESRVEAEGASVPVLARPVKAAGKGRGHRTSVSVSQVSPWTSTVLRVQPLVAIALILWWDLGASGSLGARASEWGSTLLWIALPTAMGLLLALLTDASADQAPFTASPNYWRNTVLCCALPLLLFALLTTLLPDTDQAAGWRLLALLALLVLPSPLAILLSRGASPGVATSPERRRPALAAPLLVAVLVLAVRANARSVAADMVYKQGLMYDRAQSWAQAAIACERAIALAPSEDYYQLFAGRARLEQARSASVGTEDLFAQAIAHLEAAQALSPLNADHPANLARAFRSWATSGGAAEAQSYLQRALAQYDSAIALRPHSAVLLNEAGGTAALLGDQQRAANYYRRSLAVDATFVDTWLLLGDLSRQAQDWPAALDAYRQAATLAPEAVAVQSRLGYVLAQMDDWQGARAAWLLVLAQEPQDVATLRNLAYASAALGEGQMALDYVDRALLAAPSEQRQGLLALRAQLADKIK